MTQTFSECLLFPIDEELYKLRVYTRINSGFCGFNVNVKLIYDPILVLE